MPGTIISKVYLVSEKAMRGMRNLMGDVWEQQTKLVGLLDVK